MTAYFRSKSVNITDTRVRLMSEILESIKLIKMYAWEKHFSQKLFGEYNLIKMNTIKSWVISINTA